MLVLPPNKIIILFDGDCSLCNYWVMQLIRQDKQDKFRFASQQADLGKALLTQIGVSNTGLETLVVYHSAVGYFTRSEAVFYICQNSSNWLRMLLVFKLFPSSLLDLIYKYVAKNRKKIFGPNKSCSISDPQLAHKFLSANWS